MFIWVTVAVVLLPLAFNYMQTPLDRPGIRYPMILFGLLLVVFASITTFVEQRKKQKANDNESLASKTLKFCFIPGGELFSEDMKNALERPNAADVSKCAMILLLAIVFGSGLLSFTAILPMQWPVFADWYTKDNKILWVGVYALAALWFLIFTAVINTLVWIAIRQGYHIRITDQLESLTTFFGLSSSHGKTAYGSDFWCQLSGQLDHVYGHKTWSGSKMYDLLQMIQDRKKEMGTSQWFLLQFASDALDHHVLDDPVGITFTYKDEDEYSKFLAATMRYCSQSMIWIVDKTDFHKKIFPVMVREVTLSIAAELTDIGDLIRDALEKLRDHYVKNKPILPHSDHFCKRYCTSYADHKIMCKNVSEPDKNCMYTTWDAVLEGYLVHWANDVLKKGVAEICNIDHENITKRCKKRESDRFPYPHLRKFYEHPVPKARIIEISDIQGWQTFGSSVRSRLVLEQFVAHLDIDCSGYSDIDLIDALAAHYIQNSLKLMCLIKNASDSDELQENKKKARRHIFLNAWKLFEHFSNSNTNHRVVGFAIVEGMITSESSIKKVLIKEKDKNKDNTTDKLHLDLGIYDQHVMVNSMPGEGRKRKVLWSILPKSVSVFAGLDPSPSSEEKHDEVLALKDFMTFLMEVNDNV